MARRTFHHDDGTSESWDDELDAYVRLDSSGSQVERRSLTPEERLTLDPNRARLQELGEVVDQLLLDQLMGGMF